MTPSQVMPRGDLVAGVAHGRRARTIGREPIDGAASSSGSGAHDEPVDAVDDELVRAAGVGTRHDRLAGEERLERDVAEVLVERRIDHRQRPGVQPDQFVVADAAEKRDAIGDAGLFGGALRVRPLRAVTGDDQPDVGIDSEPSR